MEKRKMEEVMSYMLGAQFHEEWRGRRLLKDGTFEPRIKTTKDEKWIAEHGTNEVDIANTSFENLPEDWKGENLAAAKVAVGLVMNDEQNDVEKMSEVVHNEWLKRNGEWAPAEQKLPYEELSEEEKAKDRRQIMQALNLKEKIENGEVNLQEEAKKYGISVITLASARDEIENQEQINQCM